MRNWILTELQKIEESSQRAIFVQGYFGYYKNVIMIEVAKLKLSKFRYMSGTHRKEKLVETREE
jgi:hypothetical protein